MKNYYLFFLLITAFTINGQTAFDEANYYLGSAYSHVKDAYDSNNISHLKYYSNRSVESFELSKPTLKSCGCVTALKLADKAIETLVKVEDAETFEDGRFYVKRGRDITKESMIEIDKCSAGVYNTNSVEIIDTSELSEIQNEQLKLKQQQEALKLKEQELKSQLAEQKEKELTLKKKQLILSYESAVNANVKTYNETLNVCNCNHDPLKFTESNDLSSESIENIKSHYSSSLKTLATNYLSQLEVCAN